MSVGGEIQRSGMVVNNQSVSNAEDAMEDTEQFPDRPVPGKLSSTQAEGVLSNAEAHIVTATAATPDTAHPTRSQEQAGVDILPRDEVLEIQLNNKAIDQEQEYPSERKVSKGLISERVAAKLRAKEISAFVPVSATDLIWLEAQSVEDNSDE